MLGGNASGSTRNVAITGLILVGLRPQNKRYSGSGGFGLRSHSQCCSAYKMQLNSSAYTSSTRTDTRRHSRVRRHSSMQIP